MSMPGGPRPGGGDTEPWAPFPVQDWSTMPLPPPDPYAVVDPAWQPPTTPPAGSPVGAPPPDARPRWLPLLVVILVTVLVAGGLFVGTRSGADRGPATARQFLPGDGQASYQRRSTTVGSETASSTHAVESARQAGGLVLGGLDYALGSKVIGQVGLDRLDEVQFWRTTGTEIGYLGSSQQHVRVYRVDGAVELIAESDRGGADIYAPALTELPAEVAAGDRWSSVGTVGGRKYRSDLRAVAAEPGCLQVRGIVVESTSAGHRDLTRQVAKTWCVGRGVVAESTVRGNVSTSSVSIPAPAPEPTLRTVDEEWQWSDPQRWHRRDFDLMSADVSLGSGPMTGTPGWVPPVVTASGLVIRPSTSEDLVATTPKTIDTWTSLWRMHPGGTIMTTAAFGDVVVATTSRREIVGYSDAGIRLWTAPMDDVAFHPAVRVDDRRIAVADAAGGVRVLDVLTGREVWRRSIGVQVTAPLVADPRVVVAFGADGEISAFAADTGDLVWSKDVLVAQGALLGDVLVVRNDATLEALDLHTGRHRWLVPQTGTLDTLQTFGTTVLAASQLDTLAIDEHGTIVQRLPPYERITVVADTMVGWGPTEAEVRDSRWILRRTMDTPDVDLASSTRPALAYRQGVILFGNGWAFTSWSDEP